MGYPEYVNYAGQVGATTLAMMEKVYQALGRRTIIKYTSFADWVKNWKAISGDVASAYTDSNNASGYMIGVGASTVKTATFRLGRLIDLDQINTITVRVKNTWCKAAGGVGFYFKVKTVQTALVSTAQTDATYTLDVSALTGKGFLEAVICGYGAWDGTINNGCGVPVYEIKFDGVLQTYDLAVDGSNYVSIAVGKVEAECWSYTVASGSFEWDTLSVFADINSGSLTIDIYDAATLGLLKADIENISDIGTLSASSILIRMRINRAAAGDTSPLVKNMWISYLA